MLWYPSSFWQSKGLQNSRSLTSPLYILESSKDAIYGYEEKTATGMAQLPEYFNYALSTTPMCNFTHDYYIQCFTNVYNRYLSSQQDNTNRLFTKEILNT